MDSNNICDQNQKQYIRDRVMRGKRKHGRNIKNITRNIELARDFINDLENNGPAGLVHVAAISEIINKPIRIWNSPNNQPIIIGKGEKVPVDIQYKNAKSKEIGHWSLRGDVDPTGVKFDLNGCLFSSVAIQIHENPSDLREATLSMLRKNIRILASYMDEILWLEKNNKIKLMIGGARYNGTSPKAAGIILDKSQNVYCDGCRYPGHPRGHASDKTATGPTDSVENYSRTTHNMKSGFLSKNDQNTVAHLALSHHLAQAAMERLNEGLQSDAVTISARDLENSKFRMPKMKEFLNGEEYTEERPISAVKLVLRHHEGKQNIADADVFVHTFYPMS